jgi:RNA-directed DNA polymerase
MKPRQLYEKQFSSENLKAIFNERIARTATTGKDGVSPAAFASALDEEVSRIIVKSSAKTYRFTTYKQKLVLKGAGKPPREISIATVRDRVVLRALTNILMEVFADRKIPAPHYFIQEISDLISTLGDEYYFVQIDIKDFYPSILHEVLMKRLRSRVRGAEILHLINCAIKTPTGSLKESLGLKGVPQGLSVSNVLSTI